MAEELKRYEILRRQADFQRIRQTGRRVSGPVLFLHCAPQPDAPAQTTDAALPERRVAFLLNRGIRTAVARNRLKRRLREVYRRNKDWFPKGHDYLLSASPRAAGLDNRQLAVAVERLALKVKDGSCS